MGLFSIIGTLAVGAIIGAICYEIYATIPKLWDMFQNFIAKYRAKKMVYEDIDKSIRTCKSVMTRQELEKLAKRGYTNVVYVQKGDGDAKVEIVRDKGNDSELRQTMRENDGTLEIM